MLMVKIKNVLLVKMLDNSCKSISDLKAVLDKASEIGCVDLVNDLYNCRTLLAYAVAKNNEDLVRNLVEIGANLAVVMGSSTTVLTLAVNNARLDGTRMTLVLLSMGADLAEISNAGIVVKDLNIIMQHWLQKAKEIGRKSKSDLEFLSNTPPMQRMDELHYVLVRQFVAIDIISNTLTAHFSNSAAQSSPLPLAK